MKAIDKAIRAIDALQAVAKYKVEKHGDQYKVAVKKDSQGRFSVTSEKNGKLNGVFHADNEKQVADYLRYNFGIKY